MQYFYVEAVITDDVTSSSDSLLDLFHDLDEIGLLWM